MKIGDSVVYLNDLGNIYRIEEDYGQNVYRIGNAFCFCDMVPESLLGLVPKTPVPTILGFMCKTDFEYDLGQAAETEFYYSLEDLRTAKRCVNTPGLRGCGIVKVRAVFEEFNSSLDGGKRVCTDLTKLNEKEIILIPNRLSTDNPIGVILEVEEIIQEEGCYALDK